MKFLQHLAEIEKLRIEKAELLSHGLGHFIHLHGPIMQAVDNFITPPCTTEELQEGIDKIIESFSSREQIKTFIYLLRVKLYFNIDVSSRNFMVKVIKLFNHTLEIKNQPIYLPELSQKRTLKVFTKREQVIIMCDKMYNQYNIHIHAKECLNLIFNILDEWETLKQKKAVGQAFYTYIMYLFAQRTPQYLYTVCIPFICALNSYNGAKDIEEFHEQEEYFIKENYLLYWHQINSQCDTIADLTMFFWVILEPTERFYSSSDIKDLFMLVKNLDIYLQKRKDCRKFLYVPLEGFQPPKLRSLLYVLAVICITETFFIVTKEQDSVLEELMLGDRFFLNVWIEYEKNDYCKKLHYIDFDYLLSCVTLHISKYNLG